VPLNLTSYQLDVVNANHHANKPAMVNSNFALRCRHLAKSTKQNVVSDSGPLALLCENMMTSTVLDVHNVFHCR